MGLTGDPELEVMDSLDLVLSDLVLQVNPDPRGPCGEPLDQPLPADAPSITVQIDNGPVLSHVTWKSDQAKQWAYDNLADTTPGCGPWESDTPFGGPQTATLVDAWLFDGVGDGASGTVLSVVGPNSPDVALSVSAILVVVDDAVSALTFFGAAVPEDFMRNTAIAMAEKLRVALGAGTS